ncbi:MAG TPA: hypothetical protein VFW11_21075 [Cyclobacteriaceae bacterium]|nr:hypothetical protein [Cyclobacteriaceae bacterium]
MKVLARILSLIVVASATTVLMNCDSGGGSEKSAEEVELGKLSATWTMTAVDLDGTDRTSDFANLVLTISGTYSNSTTNPVYSFSFTGTRPNPSPWPANGTWRFESVPNKIIRRLDDNQLINYSLTSNDTQLSMDFNYQGAGFAGGRVAEVNGDWSFTFTKQ